MKLNMILEYIVLLGILISGFIIFNYVAPNTVLQFTVGIITSVAYVVWGVIHHAIKKDLHARIVLEYILMGAIALVLLATILEI